MSQDHRPPHRTRRRAALASVAVLGIAATGFGLASATGGASDAQAPDAETSSEGTTSGPTATLERATLTETETVAGTVGFGDSWNLPIQASGVVTSVPTQGTVISFGQVVLHVANKPVHLAQGTVPLYRELRYVSSTRNRIVGEDVAQLQRFLREAGFDDDGRLEVDGNFGLGTQRAVRAWQKHHGLTVTGSIDRSQLIFSPTEVRLATAPRVGADFSEVAVTAANPTVSVTLPTRQGGLAQQGAEVSLDAGDGNAITGTVAEVRPVVTENGERQLRVTISPGGSLPDGVERVQVGLSRVVAENVVVAPVRAVLALAGGGYALEVETASGTELRRVELGSVVDDLVEVTGDVEVGDEVVVPVQIGASS